MIPLTSTKRLTESLPTRVSSISEAVSVSQNEQQEPGIKRLCRDFSNLKSPSKSGNTSNENFRTSVANIPLENGVLPGPSVSRTDSGQQISADSRRVMSTLPLFTVDSVERRNGSIELCLTPMTGNSSDCRTCSLQGFWIQTSVQTGDKVVIIGKFDEHRNIIIDDQRNFLILHPDTLISPTLIGGATYCPRKAMLQEMIRSDTTMEMFIGTLVHDLMQRIAASVSVAAKANRQPTETSHSLLMTLLRDPRYRQDMYSLNVAEDQIIESASSFIPNIEKWAWSEFAKPGVDIADIEEWIWSPRYGVKGRVDMTLRTPDGIKPLEIKTGKASYAISHTGQVLLYTLLLSEKYKMDINEGVLYYAKTGDFKTISAKHGELRGLIQMRNDISNYLKRCHFIDEKAIMNIPGPINNERSCSTCQLSTMCSLFYKAIEEPRGLRKMNDEHYIHKLVQLTMAHLQPLHLEYFEKWMIMLYLEVYNSQKNVSVLDLWLKRGSKPETGVGGLRMEEVTVTANQQLNFCLTSATASAMALHLNPGDLVLLREDSNEGLVIDLCTINSITKEPTLRINLQADRFFQNSRLKNRTFRIDKYVYSASSMAGSYDSLVKMMEQGDNAARMRSLFLQKEKPRISKQIPKKQLEDSKLILKALPKPQQTAAIKAIMALDYVFIDTKMCAGNEESSAFVATLIKILRKCDQSVLLVSSNGATLDGILRLLRDDPTHRILRLGPAARTHSDLKDLCPESLASHGTFRDFSSALRGADIVATTNGTHRQPGLMHREFDVCLVNETSCMLQPSIFGFLFLAKRFVFVGDSTKKPNCRCDVARDMGMEESLMTAMETTAVEAASWVTL